MQPFIFLTSLPAWGWLMDQNKLGVHILYQVVLQYNINKIQVYRPLNHLTF